MSTLVTLSWLLSFLGFGHDFELIGIDGGDSAGQDLQPPPQDPYEAAGPVERTGPPERISNGF